MQSCKKNCSWFGATSTCVLGKSYKVLSTRPNVDVKGTCDLVFRYSDFTCPPNFQLPEYVNHPQPWFGFVTNVSPLVWKITQVPWDTVAEVKMTTKSERTCGDVKRVLLKIKIPNGPSGCDSDLSPLVDDANTHATCIAFTWTPNKFIFTSGYYYELLNSQDVVVRSGTAEPNQSSITFNDVTDDTPYIFAITGYCSATEHGVTYYAPGVTTPFPYLQNSYQMSSVPGVRGLTNVTVIYTSYYCVSSIAAAYGGPQPWTGTVTETSTSPYTWVITDVPYDSNFLLVLTATVDPACLCGVAARVIPTIAATLTIETPSPPPPNPSTKAITGLNLQSSSATCLMYTWNKDSQFTNGYEWELSSEGVLVTEGVSPNFTLVTANISSLTPATTYDFRIRGIASSGTGVWTSADVAHTAPGCTPLLPPFKQIGNNIAFSTTNAITYTAKFTYEGYTCVTTPVLGFQPGHTPDKWTGGFLVSGNTCTVTGLLPSTTYDLCFTATSLSPGCETCCDSSTTPVSLIQPFTLTVPGTNNTCTLLSINVQLSQANSQCLTFTWTPASTAAFAKLFWSCGSQSGNLAGNVTTLTVEQLTPDTQYFFVLYGACDDGSVTIPKIVPAKTIPAQTPALPPFVQTADNATFSFNTNDTATLTFTYALGVCVTNLQLTGASGITSRGSGTWNVPNVTCGTTLALTLTAQTNTSSCGSCAGSSGETLTTPVKVIVPSKPTPPPPDVVDSPFELYIPHYSGPPPVLIGTKEAGTSATDPALFGTGDVSVFGSYLNLQSLMYYYAFQIVTNFVKYNMQRQFTVSGESFYLPIKWIYFGNTVDPGAQGNTAITGSADDGYTASRPYNFLAYYDDPTLDAPYAINTYLPYSNFAFPVLTEYFVQLMTYNWTVQNSTTLPNKRRVNIGLTNYGSKKWGEEWWFDCWIKADGTIVTNVIAPVSPTNPNGIGNPKLDNSVVSNAPLDGYPGCTDCQETKTAGYNCLERWLMHAAIMNQQLRKLIQQGVIKTPDGLAMTLNDLTQDTASYYQIAAITCDQEGSGFPNITAYGTGEEQNVSMKVLWNKWINQSQSLSDTLGTASPPSWWYSNGGSYSQLLAAGPRKFMPSTSFTLPCSLSMTTPGLISGMTTADVNAPSYDSVQCIFHEIYDIASASPFYCLGANVGTSIECQGGNVGKSVTAKSFTPDVYTAAFNSKYNTDCLQYIHDGFGTWDVMPIGGLCTGGLVLGDSGLYNDPSTTTVGASLSSFNDSNVISSPLLNTSVYNPWKYLDTTHAPTLLWKPQQHVPDGTSPDAQALGWWGEGSRCDLYNGMWASQVAKAKSSTLINYYDVKQGAAAADGSTVDGSIIWQDLSTGMKCSVAGIMNGLGSTGITSAPGQVFMISLEAGPFVNTCGVRASVRSIPGKQGPTGSDLTADDYLTFTCPDSHLAETEWPGWKGMAGQYYGIGTNANCNILQRWALNSMALGPDQYDPVKTIPLANSTEDNFGVFADMNIPMAVLASMAKDLSGKGANPNGITPQCVKFTPQTTGVPQLGIYELAYIPLAWCDTIVPQPFFPVPPKPPTPAPSRVVVYVNGSDWDYAANPPTQPTPFNTLTVSFLYTNYQSLAGSSGYTPPNNSKFEFNIQSYENNGSMTAPTDAIPTWIRAWKSASPAHQVFLSIGGGAYNNPGMYVYDAWRANPDQVVTGIVNFVKAFDLFPVDGIDLDYEDTPSLTSSGSCSAGFPEPWGASMLISICQGLKAQMPGLLISHAPQTPYIVPNCNPIALNDMGGYQYVFHNLGPAVDFYFVQMYNNPTWENCGAPPSPQTAPPYYITNIVQYMLAAGVQPTQIVVGKPLISTDANPLSYTAPADLMSCINTPKSTYGGIGFWELTGDSPAARWTTLVQFVSAYNA